MHLRVLPPLQGFVAAAMCLGLLSMMSGWCFWLGKPAGTPVVVLFVLYITWYQIKPEEQALRAKFGAAYDDYCQRVRRWI